jgi:hypothetical protein
MSYRNILRFGKSPLPAQTKDPPFTIDPTAAAVPDLKAHKPHNITPHPPGLRRSLLAPRAPHLVADEPKPLTKSLLMRAS